MGSSNENSAYKPARNPWDRTPHPGRLLRRQRRGRRRAAGSGRDRHRHRRLDPPARFLLRHHRHQADLWPRLPLRHDRLRFQPGPGRADGAHGRRLRAAAVGDLRARSRPRLHVARRAGRRLHPLAGWFDRRPAHRRAEGILRRGPGRRRARRDRRRAQGIRKAGREAGGNLAAAHRAVDPRVLHHRAGRSLVQPLALRRREVRPPRQAATATCSTCTRRPAPKASATRSSAAS